MLSDVDFWRLAELPRPDREERDEMGPERLVAALMAAHAADETVAVAWIRPEGYKPVEIFIGAKHAFVSGHMDDGRPDRVRVIYPPGAYGIKTENDEVQHGLGKLSHWVRCGLAISSSALRGDAEAGSKAAQLPAFEEYVMHLLDLPMAWLVVGVPAPREQVSQEMKALERTIQVLQEEEKGSPQGRLEKERSESRLKELTEARWKGFWDLHVLAGSDTRGNALRVASLLAAAVDFQEGRYVLRPANASANLQAALAARLKDDDLGASPLGVSSATFAAATPLPAREIPGVRLVTPHTFDVTPEGTGQIPLGEVIDSTSHRVGWLTISHDTLNRHTFVCGATGSGKSQSVRWILEELSRARIPWMVIEPAKAEYARMAGRLDPDQDVTVIRPGDIKLAPGMINPLEPEKGFSLQTHIDLIRALFLAAFEPHEPMPQVLSFALTRVYQELGWDLAVGESTLPNVTPRYPTLGDLQRCARQVVDDIGYGKEVSKDVKGFVDVRLGSLRLGTPGRFFESGHPLDMGLLLERNVVIQIEDVGDDADKAFVIGTVLVRLIEYLRLHRQKRDRNHPLRHVTVIEEAHRLLKPVGENSVAAHAVELFAGLLAEIRSYSEGILIAEQIPSKVISDVIKNTALKIVHRLPAMDDRETVGATMNLEREQSEFVVSLHPGEAAVFSDGMDRPILVAMPWGEDREAERESTRPLPTVRRELTICDPACRELPCTARQINEAQRLSREPEFVLWVEMTVIAHLVGGERPTASPDWLAGLRRRPQRSVSCAIGRAVEVAINNRYRSISAWYQPEELAAHVAAGLRAQLAEVPPNGCSPSEFEWQAGTFRWMDIYRQMRDAARAGETQRHPSTEEWERERSVVLPGRDLEAQMTALASHPRTSGSILPLIYGEEEPAPFRLAVSSLSRANAWSDRVSQATSFLAINDPWPRLHLIDQAPPARSEA